MTATQAGWEFEMGATDLVSQQPQFSSAHIIIVFVVSFMVIASVTFIQGPKQAVADEIAYKTNVFTDGNFKTDPSIIAPGRFFAPLYPTLIHLVSIFSPATREAARCFAGQANPPATPCEANLTALFIIQAALAALSATAVFVASLYMAGSRLIAIVAALLVLVCGDLELFARSYLTENIALPGFFVFLAFAAAAARRPTLFILAGAGAALGLATMSRPIYLYLWYALVPCLALAAALPSGRSLGWRWGHWAAFMGASLCIIAPWAVRNVAFFGDPQPSSGYSGYILAQRLAYDAMSTKEWFAALIYCLPDHGWGLPARLFGPDSVARMGWGPDSFYGIGTGAYMHETILAAGGRDQQLGYLVRHELLGNLFKHIMVTVPLTERGLWVARYFGLLGVLLIVPVGLDLAKAGRLLPFMAVLLPLAYMTVLHGFVSVSVTRYNEPLLTIYGFVVAYALVQWARQRKLLPGDPSGFWA